MAEESSTHFTLHLDKSMPCLVERASWNPEKDLLAMVTVDRQLTVHRFNWQKLWAVSTEKRITAICWRPSGKALAAGDEEGTIFIYDVENGDVIRKIETHNAAIQCLHWIEEKLQPQESTFLHEDRTSRFFPPPPKAPSIPGVGSAFDMVGALSSAEEQEDVRQNVASKTVEQHLNILSSGDVNGIICLNAFGVFPVGKLDVGSMLQSVMEKDQIQGKLSAVRVALSTDLRRMVVLCSRISKEEAGLVAITADTALLQERHKEIRQVALQVASVEELLETLQASLSVMEKNWTDSMAMFHEKINMFQLLLLEHGSQSTPCDELLSLLACGSASAALHQFLAVALGEGGLKRLAKNIDAAGRELQNIIAEHLQPAAEMIAFRIGEILGISRWRTRLQAIGLDVSLVDNAMENSGMLLVQVERLLQIVSNATGQFRLFFVWLTKSLRQLNGELDQTSSVASGLKSRASNETAHSSAAIAAFLKSQFEKDPIAPHLSSQQTLLDIDPEEIQRAEELVLLGGFKDTKFFQRTFSQQLQQLSFSCKEAFSKPVSVISPNLKFRSTIFLCHLPTTPLLTFLPSCLTFYEKNHYLCYQIDREDAGYIVVVRSSSSSSNSSDEESVEAIALQLEDHLTCVDLALYKERQLLVLLSEKKSNGCTEAWLMLLRLEDLPFVVLNSPNAATDLLHLCIAHDAVSALDVKDGKARCISQLDVIPPLAVSASRGLACVFAAQRRALLYDLEEDEEEK